MVDQGCSAAHQHSSEAEQRSSKADGSSRLRSFRRDLTRVSFFLASNLFSLIAPALALPTSTVANTASSTNAAPSATSSAGADRDSPFQLFADGTQDIAALVGIFATDSVEKYAIDYSKGYLATAVANLSLLGLLGYVRLLVKLGLGADGCRKAGFDMKALRPMFGVQDEEYVPTDAVHKVYYVRRTKYEGEVRWSIVKIIKHTKESFQLLEVKAGVEARDREIVSVWLKGPTHVFLLPLLSILCSALTCFPIMIFEAPLRHQSWTYYYATVGLFCFIVISTMTWMWVHIQEQHARGLSDWTVAELFFDRTSLEGKGPEWEWYATLSDYKQVFSKTSSLDLKDTFAFSRVGTGFHIYDISAAKRKFLFALKISSFLFSGSILVGYACQYIEVRRLKVTESGYWLLIQGALAAIRVVIWVWDPSWDDSQAEAENLGLRTCDKLWDYDLTETRLVALWASMRTESPNWLKPIVFVNPLSAHLSIPNWALPAFSPRNQNPKQMFELARNLTRDTIEWDDSLQILQNAENFWEMPPGLFMAWAFARNNVYSSRVGKRFSCRIIKDKQYENGEQRLHFLPCLDYGCGHSIYEEGNFELRIFGSPYNPNRCVFAFDQISNLDTNSGASPQQKLVVGSNTPISELHPTTLADRFNIKKIRVAIKRMRTLLSEIIKDDRWCSIELDTLPGANEGTQPNADQIHPRQLSSTSNNQNPANAHSP